MGLWGASTTDEHKPSYLTAEEKTRCYATPAGWVLKHLDGTTEEILVAIRGLSGAAKLGGATVSSVAWAVGNFGLGTVKSIKVTFNEKVVVTGNPTIVVTGSIDGAITATFASLDATGNTATFTFTNPVAVQDLSFANQTITLAGGTINDASTNTASDLVIPAGAVTATGVKAVIEAITAGTWGTGAFGLGVLKTIKLTYNEKVAVVGNPTIQLTGSIDGAITATYASSNAAGTILTFEFTTPLAAQDLSIAAQSVALAGGTITVVSTADAASVVITSAVATATGVKAVA